MTIDQPKPTLDELIQQIGESGARICDIEASEAGAGNISVYMGWDVEVRRHFPNAEEIELPVAAPHLAGGTVLATGSGRRLRQIEDEPLAAIGAVKIHEGGLTGTLYTANTRKFARLTSEFNSHLAVHEDQVARRGVDFQAVVHAQPPHLTYLSHVPAYQTTEAMNRAILRWEPESIVSLSQGICVLPFCIPGSEKMSAENVAGLRDFEITLWSKHGTMSRSDISVFRAVDRVEYAETGAKYEYMDIVAGGRAEGLSAAEIRGVAETFSIDSPWLQ
ncbi:class II aldolase/adducin family protein [Demequina capsici]|uniref:Class II aldolase/adducin family protein n=1 Tax=Demequina capsici TaxID=3075620 RepID=A0AA96FC61_9MICO|nr:MULTISPECIES: class II aldolase/adducin family protein [unclassified Demequina]WNM23841.1 class II aldolase/adducin family protein [Demequina sp. OYTSA14]WNM26680.1 class II aldolase/adducin family protein [Demequina sp. PMTSA13]